MARKIWEQPDKSGNTATAFAAFVISTDVKRIFLNTIITVTDANRLRLQMLLSNENVLNQPEKTADLSRPHLVSRQTMPEKRAQKFHTDDVSLST